MNTTGDGRSEEKAEGVNAPYENRAREWWQAAISDEGGDRGARSALRRCTTPLEAMTIPAAISLARRLGRIPSVDAPKWKAQQFERALGLAIVLAHVRANVQTPLVRELGWKQFPGDRKETDAGDERPRLSELRFKRFLQNENEDELIAAFCRLLALAGNETNVTDLARAFLRWDEDRTKRDLALTYFNADSRGLAA